MAKKFWRRFLKLIFIISVIIANYYWENSENVQLAFNTSQPTALDYMILDKYATEIAITGDDSIISEKNLQVEINEGEKDTLIVKIENEKCIYIAHYKTKEEFRILKDGTFKIEKNVQEIPIKVIRISKIPSKNLCICTAILICIISFVVMYILCYSIPRKLIKQIKKTTNDY